MQIVNLWTLPLLDNVFLNLSCRVLILRSSALFSRSFMLRRRITLSSQSKMFREEFILSFQWKYKWSILWYVVLLCVCFCSFPLYSYAWGKIFTLESCFFVFWMFFTRSVVLSLSSSKLFHWVLLGWSQVLGMVVVVVVFMIYDLIFIYWLTKKRLGLMLP